MRMRAWQVGLLVALIAIWHVLVQVDWLPKFFFGEPLAVGRRIVAWFASGEIWPHLLVTLGETIAAFIIGTATGIAAGLWLGVSPFAARLLDPYIKGFNAMPRVILAPIFAVWFGLGMTGKIVLGITLVFFVVFFSVFHGVRDVNPVIVANARMLGAARKGLLRHVYLPSALSWAFASLHTAVGMAFVGAVVGEYLGSARGVGYLILQAEGTFDIDTVLAGVVVLTVCALLLDAAVSIAEKRLLRWRPEAKQDTA
jgi:NitT/TauT family transport system permease protein